MTIYVNEKPYEVEEGTSLATFIAGAGIQQQGVAIAIAYEVVPREKWADTLLTGNMQLMLIQAVSGG